MKTGPRIHMPQLVRTVDGFECVTDVGRSGVGFLWSWAIHLPVDGPEQIALVALGHSRTEAEARASVAAQVAVLSDDWRRVVLS